MKRIVIVVLILCTYLNVFGQLNTAKKRDYTHIEKQELFQKAIKNNEFKDDIFSLTETPEQWKEESAVILARRTRYVSRINPWNNVGYFTVQTRVRVKVQDLTAVEDFSTYYFDKDDYIEITIEKPDGTRKKVALNEAIAVTEKVNLAYFGDIEVENYKKIAFSNLEPGDILDVVAMETKRFNKNLFHWTDVPLFFIPTVALKNFFGLLFNLSNPFEYEEVRQLNESLPIVEQKIEFDLGKHLYLNYRALNGAPDLEEKVSKTHRRNKLWVFNDVMREKLKTEPWSEPIYTLPAIKYEIIFANKRSRNKIDKFIDKKTRLKTTVTDNDIRKVVRPFYRNSRYSTGNIYYEFYKKEGYKISDDRAFIDAFYNYYRSTKLYELAMYDDGAVYDIAVPNAEFVQYMVKILKKRGITHKIIAGVPRYRGGMDGLLAKSDFIWGIKVYYQNDEVLYTDCDLYALPGEVNPEFEGIKLYEITPARYKRGIEIEETSIPVTPPTQNKFFYKITAEFLPDYDTLLVTRRTELTGMARYKYKSETFPYNKYYKTLREKRHDNIFVSEYLYDNKLRGNDKFLEKEEKRIEESMLGRRSNYVKKNAERELKNDHEVVDYKNLKVDNDGLAVDQATISFVEEFRLRDLLDEVGDGSYILKVGEFIGSQIEIKDLEDRERQGDVVYNYARTSVYQIEIKIPALMKVYGIEQLTREIENETGSFKSSATMQGNSLIINVEKTYKDIYQPKDKWEDLLKFIDEAVDFRSSKLILTR